MENQEFFRGLAQGFAGRHQPNAFIETGSATGLTSEWAATQFKSVVTIEFKPENYYACVERFWNSKVKPIWGDSAEVLPIAINSLFKENKSVMPGIFFWLDAHCDYDGAKLAPSGLCPVVKELEAIHGVMGDHLIVIDDARLFDGIDWPSLDDVLTQLRDIGYPNIIVEHDMIIARKK